MSLREDFEIERLHDRFIFHEGPDGSQRPEAGFIGICDPKDETKLFCVGCYWCDPNFAQWAAEQRRATA